MGFFIYFSRVLKCHANGDNLQSPMETICMECQNMLSGKNKKIIINLSSAELAKKVVMVNCFNVSSTSEVEHCLNFVSGKQGLVLPLLSPLETI